MQRKNSVLQYASDSYMDLYMPAPVVPHCMIDLQVGPKLKILELPLSAYYVLSEVEVEGFLHQHVIIWTACRSLSQRSS